MRLNDYLDVLIPRRRQLNQTVLTTATVPVIKQAQAVIFTWTKTPS